MAISCARVSTRKQRNSLGGQHIQNTRYALLLQQQINEQIEHIGSGEEILFTDLIYKPPDILIFVSVDRFGRNKTAGMFWARALVMHGHELHFIEDNLILNNSSTNMVWRRLNICLDHANFELNRIRHRINRVRAY